MKLEKENSSKKRINFAKKDITNEDKKNRLTNDSYNIDNSYGENYSTANSTFENNKKKKQNVIKENIEFTIKGKTKTNQGMETMEETDKEIIINSQNVDEYIYDILVNLFKEEKSMTNNINPNYFGYQKEINQSMRSILIDWLIDVHDKLNFKQETLYITIYIIDSFLSKKIIERRKFQLLGITALLIASKLNEIDIRRIGDYVIITDNAYTKDDIKKMEEEIAQTFNFNFLVPSPLSFFEIISKISGISDDKDKSDFGEFLIQSFLIDFRSLNYSYSIIAYASCFIIMKICKMNNYQFFYDNIFFFGKNNNLYDNNANFNLIIECANNIYEIIRELSNSNYKSTFTKYSKHNIYATIKNIFEIDKK